MTKVIIGFDTQQIGTVEVTGDGMVTYATQSPPNLRQLQALVRGISHSALYHDRPIQELIELLPYILRDRLWATLLDANDTPIDILGSTDTAVPATTEPREKPPRDSSRSTNKSQ